MANKPRLLDLFCGGGGAGVGYARAGFDVMGVDINPQPNYPFEFHQADAMSVLNGFAEFSLRHGPFDLIHASPPCQGYTSMNHRGTSRASWPLLIDPVRNGLIATGLPYVIENVPGAGRELVAPVRVCGTVFGLEVWRHRLFESGAPIIGTGCRHDLVPIPKAVYGPFNGRVINRHVDGSVQRAVRSNQEGADALGVGWSCSDREIAEAIPPAYTEWIGRQLIEVPDGE